MDVFATILEHAGIAQSDETVPSRSLMPIVKGDDPENWNRDAVFAEQEETRVIRTAKWVYFKRFSGAGTRFEDELFDIENDPDETRNLASDAAFADVIADLDARLCAYFETYSDQRADLWKGGTPIQHSERKWIWRDAWGEEWQPVIGYEPA